MATDAKTIIYIPELDKNDTRAVLKLVTSKAYNGGLASFASIEFHGDRFVTCELFGDFSVRLLYNRAARATQKAIDAQHAQAFTPERIADLKAKLAAYYAEKNAA